MDTGIEFSGDSELIREVGKFFHEMGYESPNLPLEASEFPAEQTPAEGRFMAFVETAQRLARGFWAYMSEKEVTLEFKSENETTEFRPHDSPKQLAGFIEKHKHTTIKVKVKL